MVKHFLTGFIVILCVFMGCTSPFMDNLPKEPAWWKIDPAGTPLYAYMDSGYNMAEKDAPDAVKTVLLINENKLAEDVVIVAETFPGDCDDAVRLIDKKSGIVISLFFHKDQRFPWSITIDIAGNQLKAMITPYNWAMEQYLGQR